MNAHLPPGKPRRCRPVHHTLRGQTRENAFSVEELRELGITVESWAMALQDGSYPGYVACMHGQMLGYCFGDRDSGEIVVLALLPDYEGQGIGKALLTLMVEDLRRTRHYADRARRGHFERGNSRPSGRHATYAA